MVVREHNGSGRNVRVHPIGRLLARVVVAVDADESERVEGGRGEDDGDERARRVAERFAARPRQPMRFHEPAAAEQNQYGKRGRDVSQELHFEERNDANEKDADPRQQQPLADAWTAERGDGADGEPSPSRDAERRPKPPDDGLPQFVKPGERRADVLEGERNASGVPDHIDLPCEVAYVLPVVQYCVGLKDEEREESRACGERGGPSDAPKSKRGRLV